MSEFKILSVSDFLSELEEKKNIRSPKGKIEFITYLIKPETNIQGEINYFTKHQSDKFAPRNQLLNAGAKRTMTYLRDLKKTGIPKEGLLILVHGNKIESYKLPFDIDLSISPKTGNLFHLDEIIEKIKSNVNEKDKEIHNINLDQYIMDITQYNNNKVNLYPGITEIQKILSENPDFIKTIYCIDDFSDDKEKLETILDSAKKLGIETVKLNGLDLNIKKQLVSYGNILAISYFKEEDSLTPEQGEFDRRIRDSKRYFSFNEEYLVRGFESVESIEDFVKNEIEKTTRPLYYIVGERGDGKTQSMQYIIRNYLEKIDDLRYFPIDCPIRLELDSRGNIINFWKYLKIGFRNMYSKIKEDQNLMNSFNNLRLTKNKTLSEFLRDLEKDLDTIQIQKGWDDEKTVIELIKTLVDRGYFRKVVLCIDELDKPEFDPVVKNFLNFNQDLFTELFKSNCTIFMCAKPEWFKYITKDSDLNFYTGTFLKIPEIITKDQCRNLIRKRYQAYGLEPPVSIDDKGYSRILDVAKRRRTIIEKYIDLVVYCEKFNKKTISNDEIHSIVGGLDPQITNYISKKLINTKLLEGVFKQIFQTGDLYLDTIDLVFRYWDKQNLKIIENPNKRLILKNFLNSHNFEIEEFLDGWEWMKAANLISKEGKINDEFRLFINDVLNQAQSDSGVDHFTLRDILLEINKMYKDNQGRFIAYADDLKSTLDVGNNSTKNELSCKSIVGEYESFEEVEKAFINLFKGSHNQKRPSDIKKYIKELEQNGKIIIVQDRGFYYLREGSPQITEKDIMRFSDPWMLNLISRLRQKIKSIEPTMAPQIFKNIEADARNTILDELSILYKEYNLGNITFNTNGILKTFSNLNKSDTRLVEDFFSPPEYMKTKPDMYVGVVESFLQLIRQQEVKLSFSMEDFLNKWITSYESIQQYKDLKYEFLPSKPACVLINRINKNTPDKFYLTKKDLDSEGISKDSLITLVEKGIIESGTLLECPLCNDKIVMPYTTKNIQMPIHAKCKLTREYSNKVFRVLEDLVYYFNIQNWNVPLLLNFIFTSNIEKSFKTIYLRPSLNGDFNKVDAIMINHNDNLIGIKVVSSINEINDLSKNYPRIFSDFWFIPKSDLQPGNKGANVIPPQKVEEWIKERLRNVKTVPVKEFTFFRSNL